MTTAGQEPSGLVITTTRRFTVRTTIHTVIYPALNARGGEKGQPVVVVVAAFVVLETLYRGFQFKCGTCGFRKNVRILREGGGGGGGGGCEGRGEGMLGTRRPI